MSAAPVILSQSGPLSSEGIRVTPQGDGRFTIELAASRGLPACPNMLQAQVLNAANRELRLTVSFPHPHPQPKGLFDEYFHAATPDFKEFRVLNWSLAPNGLENQLIIPATGWDAFALGMQLPLPAEALDRLIAGWKQHPDARVECIGQSIRGRPVWKLTVTAREGPFPEQQRWRHHVVNFHPGEGNARWRMVGMIDELLRDASRKARQQAVFTFIPLLCPDGPAAGWRRVNADGIDMNRCFRVEGEDAAAQTREAWLYQALLEREMRSPHPVHSVWCLHTWPGPMEPLVDGCGPEFGTRTGTIADLQQRLVAETGSRPCKPLRLREQPGMEQSWNGGIHRRFGITTVLVEGGGEGVLHDHLEDGAALLRAISRFWEL